ncbi:MAG: histidine phosphatase family protein [Clostridiales bacterium]|jgi:probable phosphoglycerate mutase|nr:histidine phosphatase family protein [Clostridiales bacterium]
MELYLIRHGETIWNKAGKIQGHADIALNENGRQIAMLTGKALEDVHFDKIFSSPLVRAYETAKIIGASRNIDIIISEELKEIGFGEYEGAVFNEHINDPQSPIYTFFKKPDSYIPSKGGESIEDLCLRAARFLEEVIMPLEKSCERVMAVAHGAMIKALLTYIKKLDKKDFWSGAYQKNCAVTIIDIKASKLNIIKEGIILADLT